MAIKYIWQIDNLEVTKSLAGKTDVISTVHWRIIATDDEFTASEYGTIGLNEPDETFEKFQEVTLDTVINWVKVKLFAGEEGDQTEDDVEKRLAEQIADQKSPLVVNKMPDSWDVKI